ncbi:N-acetylmuramoyl-L-alanine amidase [Candidatus Falkowbacteria bacterium HGW-Falkowbacteria-2]|uniref:N-acetylmuramoyl-L-alanine amidase n=1 Tax=Candidatus Falkowbacteria bacterium HGW-Falkowbacteria-2 TaxID=2013769 RepID=A0A2N2E1S6_9BACT|nr:MAG: N-acetylmuramoyl-L-alanine amidase [Candidatus Falkowbacteria bacterium HGW-Falkowbacteria-2]
MDKIDSSSVEFIVIHHSNRILDCPLFIRLRHKFLRGWDDTGYHYMIGNGILCKDGVVYEGRSTDYVGAHSYGYNQKSIGICLIGNFDVVKPTYKQYRALLALLEKLQVKYTIPAVKVLNHNETHNCEKTCPGKHFPISRLRQLLRMLIE